jgi:ABC-type transport system involved in multi-copper enzyme maturation permease subunit
MIRAELYKVRHHLTPLVLVAGATLLLLIAPAYFALQAPEEVSTYTDTLVEVFEIAAVLGAAVLGAWPLGNEYRQRTLQRVVGIEGRRTRLLGTKAVILLGTFTVGMSAAFGVGLAATVAAATVNNDSLVTGGLGGDFGGAMIWGVVTLSVAYTLSVLLRSDTYATLASVGLVTVSGRLLAAIPTVGPYFPASGAIDVGAWVSGEPSVNGDAVTHVGRAALLAALWLLALAIAAQQAFARRDI